MMKTREELARELEYADVPLSYRNCRFDTFNAYTENLKRQVKEIQQLALAKNPKSLFLSGKPGRGKTHLAVAVMAEFLGRGARGAFVSAVDYALKVQQNFGNPSHIVEEFLDLYLFLLVDDLGAEKLTEGSRQAVFFLIDRFYSEKRRLIITSNRPAELHYRDDPRVGSRLLEMCAFFELKEEDFRVRKAQEMRNQ
jgi:DNA replication protein DnaC